MVRKLSPIIVDAEPDREVSLKTVWRVRYEGCPDTPRFRRTKRRTACIVTDEKGAKEYVEQLERGLHVKVLSIKPKEA